MTSRTQIAERIKEAEGEAELAAKPKMHNMSTKDFWYRIETPAAATFTS